ncbi:hypothetical protein [Chryseobacterium arthrosphaerae]|uniref:hypothetical protein n=1 Tax=Chryseobacterium arthrosphaerae TaxID=651561 RepID=UPI001F4B6050|nr:hypothetical protein [Chryseobacterium arthrosphaerae]MDG4654296.1 hypothetical protein [Chryseobacterium arthrosphaerae]
MMEIKILTYLKDNPAINPGNKEYEGRIEPMSSSEVQNHEEIYNNGKPFPEAVRELLFLAGKRCHVLSHNILDINELQENPREWMQENNKAINRPFYVIECWAYEESFLFVYLDETDDPIVRQAYLFCEDYNIPFISNLSGHTLSEFINHRINLRKQGYNPF